MKVDSPGMLDLIVTLLLALGQWRFAVLVVRRSSNRRAAVLGMLAWETVVAAGYFCSNSELISRQRVSGAAIYGAIAFCYLLTTGCAAALYSLWQPLYSHLQAGTSESRRRALQLAGEALIAAPFVAVGYGVAIERTRFEVREVEMPVPGLAGDLDGLRMLQMSDIHLSAFLSEREFARMVDAACELRPHIAFATGDFISTFGDPLEACIRQLARLKSDAGIFGCLGNHERYAHAEDEASELAKRAGIRILRGESQELKFGGARLNLAGVDYESIFDKKEYLRGAEGLVRPDAFNLLLSHNPDVFPVAASQGYQLTIGGHTHGGQVTVEILNQSVNPARVLTPYVRGHYQLGGSSLYVTRGIGTVGLPARVGAPPEITLLRLRKA
ncbi:MAG: metallophosphoesterase [Acidobacteriia bacterium]|nr:metallophosphoesterase [Terriglobia bacterium]